MEIVEEEPNGVFLSEMTDEEYEQYDREVNKGWGSFFKEVLSINKSPNGEEKGDESATEPK